MRKLILTTTALVLTSGATLAEVSLSGKAEMGLAGSKDDSARLHTDVDVTFTLSGRTDSGLTFGTAINLSDLDGEKNDATSNDDHHGGIEISLKGPFGNLALGDTDGAFDWAMREVDDGIGGSIRDDHQPLVYYGNDGLDGVHDGQILRYDHAFGNFSFAASLELDDDLDNLPVSSPVDAKDGTAQADVIGKGDEALGLGARYSTSIGHAGSLGVGVGYQIATMHFTSGDVNSVILPYGFRFPFTGEFTTDIDVAGLSLDLDLRGDDEKGFQGIANYTRANAEAKFLPAGSASVAGAGKADATHLGLGFGYTFGSTTVGANWASAKAELPLEIKATGIGLNVSHDLGGGAVVQLGVGNDEIETTTVNGLTLETDTHKWSLGLAFGF